MTLKTQQMRKKSIDQDAVQNPLARTLSQLQPLKLMELDNFWHQ